MATFETIFDAGYLCLVVSLGVYMLLHAKGSRQYSLFGAMAVILGGGDAFHLVPRMVSLWTENGFTVNITALGIGQLVTSITMTVFYLVLYFIWRQRYKITGQQGLTVTMLLLAAARVALCLFPQNAWTSPDAPLSWGIYRNIPFAAMGILVIVLFYQQAKKHNDKGFRFMWLAITLSFAFYAPVVLFAQVFPPVGALMMPKTVAYVWMVWMGFAELRRQK
ncbi:MAG: hypothetical protein RR185_01730 [Angelakisella sp.]